jgi:hypothetical protein
VTSGTLPYPPIAVPPPTTITQPSSLAPGPFRAVANAIGDLLGITVIVLCVPFVILAVAMPLVLFIRLLMWLAALL